NPSCTFPCRTEMGWWWQEDNCNSYLTYLLSDLRNSSPLKKPTALVTGLVVVKEHFWKPALGPPLYERVNSPKALFGNKVTLCV
ncbi:hypothetical protein AVEN_22844-1, partial [Araneus ventricosus]